MMNTDFALLTAGIFFFIVAVTHLLRLFFKTEVTIGKFKLPVWTSLLGLIISLGLAIWMFMAKG